MHQATGFTVLRCIAALAVSTTIVIALNTQEANKYRPIYKFDGASSSYCYPDIPTKSHDGRCVTQLNPASPVYVQENTCGEYTVFTYWLWYGKQKPCIAFFDSGHGNDWEHVSVYVKGGKVKKVVFHQHNGHYTRRTGKFESDQERPVVYIGKIAHGSYHHGCDGRCSFTELIFYGCFGTVNYCVGGCGYWDDYRNPGPTLRNAQVQPLQPGKMIDGIVRPNREVCNLPTCEGSKYRSLTKSGCWQDST